MKPYENNNNSEPKEKIARIEVIGVPKRPQTLGRVLVCGQGDTGQLGLGDDVAVFEKKRPTLIESIDDAVDITAGGMHNLILTSDGRVLSFGCNDEGALGRDSSADGSEFEPEFIELPRKVVKVSAGDSHSACLLEDGNVYAWGSFRDSHGNMGLTLEGNKRIPIPLLGGIPCCDIASGADHLVVLTITGQVYTIGCGEQGQLGRVGLKSASGESRRGKTELLYPGLLNVRKAKFDAIWATSYCTFVREKGSHTIWGFGLNNYKQLGITNPISTIIRPVKTNLKEVKQIAGGPHHTVVLKLDGTCLVIGRCDYGRLGLGNVKSDLTEFRELKSLADKCIVSVSCGEAQNFAVTNDGKVYAWGMGSNNQLGTGSDDDEFKPVIIESKQMMGKFMLRAASGGQHSIFLVSKDTPLNPEPAKEVATNKAKQGTKMAKANEKTNGDNDKAGNAKNFKQNTDPAPKRRGRLAKKLKT